MFTIVKTAIGLVGSSANKFANVDQMDPKIAHTEPRLRNKKRNKIEGYEVLSKVESDWRAWNRHLP